MSKSRRANENRKILYVPERTPDDVTTALGRIKEREGLSRITFLGPSELSFPAQVAARVLNVKFEQESFSIEALLRSFGMEPELATELSAGLEQAIGLGREA